MTKLYIHVAAALARWWQAYTAHRWRLEGIAALQGLSDHQLKDLGISRSEIPLAVRHGRYSSRSDAVVRDLKPVSAPKRTSDRAGHRPDDRYAA